MKEPTIKEFDSWRNSAVGTWFFDHYLQGYADHSAKENGKGVGSYDVPAYDHMIYVRNAGVINGIEYAITSDPFEEIRDEDKGNREIPVS